MTPEKTSSDDAGTRSGLAWIALLFCLLPFVCFAGSPPESTGVPALTSDNTRATAGFFNLSWTLASAPFELQEATNKNFTDAHTLYTGADRARVISGKSDGHWYYRIRSGNGPWSEALLVEVAHHSLARGLGFFALGLFLFLATSVMIIRGNRGTQ